MGSQQDCLGMTPLHSFACSTEHNLEQYCVIIEQDQQDPTNLITENMWEALPLLNAFWEAANSDLY